MLAVFPLTAVDISKKAPLKLALINFIT